MAQREEEEGESGAGVGGVIALLVLTLITGAAAYLSFDAAREFEAFASSARLTEAEVTLVERWMSGGDVRTWNHKAALTFTTEDGEMVSGEIGIGADTFARLSTHGAAQPTHSLSKRERYALEPGRATLPIQYLPKNPERFEDATWDPEPQGMRIESYILLGLSAILGFFAIASAVVQSRKRR